MNKQFLIFFLIVLIGISIGARLLPHPPNFAPIAALALFAGVYASRLSKWYLFTPLAAMFVSDLLLGFYDWKIMAVVYASFFAIGLIGLLVRMFKARLQTAILGTLVGSILFYLTTNFAVWAFSGMYPLTPEGLFLSYYMALPFFKFTLLGDLFYVALFFGGYAFIANLSVSRESLSPLGSPWRLRSDVVENAGDLGNFRKIVWKSSPIRSHNIRLRRSPQSFRKHAVEAPSS